MNAKFQAINGWTRSSMIGAIWKRNNGKQALSKSLGGCVYHTDDGNSCPVGCFMPEGYPLPRCRRSEAINATLLADYPELAACMPLELDGLVEMQKIHDLHTGDRDIRGLLTDWILENVWDKPLWVAAEKEAS